MLSKLLRINKNTYYKNFFTENKNDLKQKWKAVNEIIGVKSNTDLSPKLIIHNNTQITNHKDMADVFNDFYGSIADKTKQKIPATEKNFTDYLGESALNSIYFSRVTPTAVLILISKLDVHKALSPSSVPTSFLKIIAPTASTVLSHIFNRRFRGYGSHYGFLSPLGQVEL